MKMKIYTLFLTLIGCLATVSLVWGQNPLIRLLVPFANSQYGTHQEMLTDSVPGSILLNRSLIQSANIAGDGVGVYHVGIAIRDGGGYGIRCGNRAAAEKIVNWIFDGRANELDMMSSGCVARR